MIIEDFHDTVCFFGVSISVILAVISFKLMDIHDDIRKIKKDLDSLNKKNIVRKDFGNIPACVYFGNFFVGRYS